MAENNLAESMDESIQEELTAIRGRDSEKAEESENDDVETEAAGEDTSAAEDGETGKDGDGEAADEGKGGEAETGTEESAEEDTAEAEDDTEEEDSEEDEFLKPPSTLRAQAKADWAKTPKSVREDFHKREQDTLKGLGQYKEQAQFGERLNSVIQPYQAFLNSTGATPEAVVRDGLNLAYQLHSSNPQQKGEILRKIAKQYGAELGGTQEQDPDADKMGQYINPLAQELTQLKQMIYGQQQQTEQQKFQEANSMVETFANAVDESGNPAHPYFDNVRDMMTSLLESGRATTLEDAYEKAVWADPDTRQVLMSEQTKEAKAKRQEEARKKAAKAEKANKANLSKKGKFDSDVKATGTIDDTISQTLESIRSRS